MLKQDQIELGRRVQGQKQEVGQVASSGGPDWSGECGCREKRALCEVFANGLFVA